MRNSASWRAAMIDPPKRNLAPARLKRTGGLNSGREIITAATNGRTFNVRTISIRTISVKTIRLRPGNERTAS